MSHTGIPILSIFTAAIIGSGATANGLRVESESPVIRQDSSEWIKNDVQILTPKQIKELIDVDQENWFTSPQWATATSLAKDDSVYLISSAHVQMVYGESDFPEAVVIKTPIAYFYPSTIGGNFDPLFWMDTFIQPQDISIDDDELEEAIQCTLCVNVPPEIEDGVAGRLRLTPTSVAGELVGFDGTMTHVVGTILETSWAPEDGLHEDSDQLFIPQFSSNGPLQSADVVNIRNWSSMRVMAEKGMLGTATIEDVDAAWAATDQPPMLSHEDRCRRNRVRCITTASNTFIADVNACISAQSWWNSVKKLWPVTLKGSGLGCATGGASGRYGSGVLKRLKGGAGLLYGAGIGAAMGGCFGAYDNYQNNVACFDMAQLDHRIAIVKCNMNYQACIDNGQALPPG